MMTMILLGSIVKANGHFSIIYISIQNKWWVKEEEVAVVAGERGKRSLEGGEGGGGAVFLRAGG
jgi:hypothetical protein